MWSVLTYPEVAAEPTFTSRDEREEFSGAVTSVNTRCTVITGTFMGMSGGGLLQRAFSSLSRMGDASLAPHGTGGESPFFVSVISVSSMCSLLFGNWFSEFRRFENLTKGKSTVTYPAEGIADWTSPGVLFFWSDDIFDLPSTLET